VSSHDICGEGEPGEGFSSSFFGLPLLIIIPPLLHTHTSPPPEVLTYLFENRVLRRIFGPRRDEVTGDWRKLHNEELHNLYSAPNIIRMSNEMGRACSVNAGYDECI
jgi:hypothetical protein